MNPRGIIAICLLFLGSAAFAEIDFSSCGYKSSDHAIPLVPIRAVVTEGGGEDDRVRIQAAIDLVASMEPDAAGFRGAVLLKGSKFKIGGPLLLRASGVILRGCGTGETALHGFSIMREPMIRIVGQADLKLAPDTSRSAVDDRVAVGATRLTLDSSDGLSVGESILITRPCTKEWIISLGMDREGIAWKRGTREIRWERRVIEIQGDQIELDAPITTALEAKFGGARVDSFEWPGRITNVGVENLALVAEAGSDAQGIEDRPWFGVTMENVIDGWIRQVTFSGLAGSAVALWESAKNVTVQDCISRDPRSELGGHRRHTFFTMGQQTLFLRCWSEQGRHDFAVGHCAAGPNAFVACHADQAHEFSGTLGSWASGLLYDNVSIDGAALQLGNHWSGNQGAGWSAANSSIWQANASEIGCFSPPGAPNKAVGTWGLPVGSGTFQQNDEFAKPRSLFRAQLANRLGGEHRVEHLGPIGRDYPGATNPSPAEAKSFVENSDRGAQTLEDVIESADQREWLWNPSRDELGSAVVNPRPEARVQAAQRKVLAVKDGRLFVGKEPLRGKRFTPIWWRGTTRPGEAPSLGPAITRFVPGRTGSGFTDDLGEVVKELRSSGHAVVEHHHGLWYDRRRDDHTRVRRANGDAIPPFYEQPFARSGTGKAFDGLSKHDLTKYNPWYWRRLKDFADRCDESGLVLLHQHYFQHNLLEAGAHWTDFPWRSANNINDTGFPEPPPYAGDKRIFQAHLFYDVSHPRRRDLHQRYIRQCLKSTAENRNVIHSLGAEFTGPLAFVEFWLDTIVAWERETGHEVMVSLSCTKDVQDAILTDPVRAQAISIIDIRYWWYASDGKLHAPTGGMNLSPRQHARRLKPKRPSTESKRRAVHEYRKRFPSKAVLFDGEPYN